jgi:hypothetical protein
MQIFFKTKIIKNIFGLIILISAFIYMYLGWKEREDAFKKVAYVRVKIDNINISMRGGPYFFYKYKINNISFEDSHTIANTTMVKESDEKIKSNLGRYFYLKVSKNKPIYNDLLLEYSVIDTTLVQPKRGWEVLPEKVKSKYVKINIFGDELQ